MHFNVNPSIFLTKNSYRYIEIAIPLKLWSPIAQVLIKQMCEVSRYVNTQNIWLWMNFATVSITACIFKSLGHVISVY